MGFSIPTELHRKSLSHLKYILIDYRYLILTSYEGDLP